MYLLGHFANIGDFKVSLLCKAFILSVEIVPCACNLSLAILHDANRRLNIFIVGFPFKQPLKLLDVTIALVRFHGFADLFVNGSLAFLHEIPLIHQLLEAALVRCTELVRLTLILSVDNFVEGLGHLTTGVGHACRHLEVIKERFSDLIKFFFKCLHLILVHITLLNEVELSIQILELFYLILLLVCILHQFIFLLVEFISMEFLEIVQEFDFSTDSIARIDKFLEARLIYHPCCNRCMIFNNELYQLHWIHVTLYFDGLA